MSLQRTLDILQGQYSGLGHFYIEYGSKATTRFYPWKNSNRIEFRLVELMAAVKGVPFKSDDKYTFVDFFDILFDKDAWELAKLYFCAKKEPSSSFLKFLPLDIFKGIFYFVYPRKRMNVFSEIVSDIHLFVLCAQPIFFDQYIITAILNDKDIHDKYKVVLAQNIKNLLSQSNCNKSLKSHFKHDLEDCKIILAKNKKTGEYEYSIPEPIKEENSKKKQKTK